MMWCVSVSREKNFRVGHGAPVRVLRYVPVDMKVGRELVGQTTWLLAGASRWPASKGVDSGWVAMA